MIITDGKRTIDVEMKFYRGDSFSPDNAEDILNDGSLVFDGELYHTIEPSSIDSTIEYLEDWNNYRTESDHDLGAEAIQDEIEKFGYRTASWEEIALDSAGGYEFSEYDADYDIESCIPAN